jgi:putative copper resistance protein D
MAVEGLLATGYLIGVRRLAARGRRWARRRTASFLGGLLVLVIALQSGLASLDDIFWVHIIQHLAMMMVAPALLVAGAPVVLGLAAGGPALRRTLRSVVRDPSMRLTEGRLGVAALAVDYYGTMFVYLLSPLYRTGEAHPVVHELVHLYFIGCGLVFWHGLIGTSARRQRRTRRLNLAAVALGVPAMAVLGLVTALRGAAIAPGLPDGQVAEGAVALVLGGAVATAAGLAIMAAELGPRRTPWILRPASGRSGTCTLRTRFGGGRDAHHRTWRSDRLRPGARLHGHERRVRRGRLGHLDRHHSPRARPGRHLP